MLRFGWMIGWCLLWTMGSVHASSLTNSWTTSWITPTTLPASSTTKAPVTFEIINNSDQPLVLSTGHGWQAVVNAYSGKKRKAKGHLLFPKHCTQSCKDDNYFPQCTSTDVIDANAQSERISIKPGGRFSIPWDGLFIAYRDKAASRRCFVKKFPRRKNYTIVVQGVRIAKPKTGCRSRLQRVETIVRFPLSKQPSIIPIIFPQPEPVVLEPLPETHSPKLHSDDVPLPKVCL